MDLLIQLEISITLFFQNLGAWMAPIFAAFSFLGTEEFYIILLPAIYWCIDAGIGFRIGVMLVLTNSINGFLKIMFHSPRPFWVDARIKAYASETSFGLPSGHSQNAASIFGILAAKFKRTWLSIVCIGLIIFIGLSRIYLGVHFTRDVLSGWLIGGVLLVLFLLLEKPVSSWIVNKSLPFQIILTALISAVIIALGYLAVNLNSGWQMPAQWVELSIASGGVTPDPFNMEGFFTISGVWFGFVSGYAWWLKKKGKIIIAGSLGKRITRYFFGLIGLVIIYAGLKLLFPGGVTWFGLTLRFIRYALIGTWVSALAPWMFEKTHLDQ